MDIEKSFVFFMSLDTIDVQNKFLSVMCVCVCVCVCVYLILEVYCSHMLGVC